MKLKEKMTAEKKKQVIASRGTNDKDDDCKYHFRGVCCRFCYSDSVTTSYSTGSDTNENSDNEPLIEVSKEALQAKKKVKRKPEKNPVHKEDGSSSDDEPLSALARKLKPNPLNEANVKDSRAASKAIQQKGTAERKRGKSRRLCSL